MNLRWLWLDHFPAGMKLSDEERKAVRKLAHRLRAQDPRYRGTRRRAALLALATIGPLSIVFLLWMCWPLFAGKPFSSAWANITSNAMAPIVFNALLWLCIAWTIDRTTTPFIRRALCDLGRPVCIECGYILEGLDRSITRCPECGADREAMPDKSS